jgi:Gpi18-like mannosyltransferase
VEFKLENMQWKTIFLLNILIRIPLFLIPMNFGDASLSYKYIQFFFNGDLPYCECDSPIYAATYGEFRNQPPLFYYLTFFLFYITGNRLLISIYVLKITWMIFDLALMRVLFLITEKIANLNAAKIVTLLYGLSPTSLILEGYLGVEESFVQFFGLLGILFYLKEKHGSASICFGIGIAQKLLPIFFFLILIPVFLKQKKYKLLFIYMFNVTVLYVILLIPYLITCPEQTLKAQFAMIGRDSSVNIFPLEYQAVLSNPLFSILFLDISIKFIIQLSIMGLLFLFFFQNQNRGIDFIKNFFLLYLMLPFLTFSVHLRYFYWITPFMIIYYLKNRNFQIDTDKFNKFIKSSLILNGIWIVAMVIYHYLFWADYSQIEIGTFQYFYFLIILGSYLIIWMVFNMFQKYDNFMTRIYPITLSLFLFAFITCFSSELGFTFPGMYIVTFILLLTGSSISFLFIKNEKNIRMFGKK